MTSTLPWNLGDPALTTWILSWEWHALLDEPGRFFDGNLFHPYGEAVKYSDLILPVLPFFGLVLALGGSPILAHNASILALSLFCVITTYLLAVRLVKGPSSMVAAVAFSFSGYVFMHQSHLQLLTLGFFPLAFLMLFRALEHQRVRDGVWLGLSSALLATASFYYAAIWLVCLTLVVAADALRIRWPGRQWWSTLGPAAGVMAVLVGPIAYVYAEFQARVTFVREVAGLGLNPIDLLTPARGSMLYSGLFDWAAARQPAGLVEHGFFLGFIVLSLASAGSLLWVTRVLQDVRHRALGSQSPNEIGYLVLAGSASLLLALGPEVRGIPMPFALLDGLPGYSSIRAVSRFAVPSLLAACVLAAWFLSRVLAAMRPTVRSVAALAVTIAVLLELAVVPSRVLVGAPSQAHGALGEAPPGAVIELPMVAGTDPAFVFVEGPRMLASVGHWRPRFNGFSGGFPPGYLDDILTVSRFPDPSAMGTIDELGLRYIILHGSSVPHEGSYGLEEIEEILDELEDSASVAEFDHVWLIDLRPGQPTS